MIDVSWSALVGTAATACSALSFLPQVLKVRRQGGHDLSAAMLALLLSGAGLWLAYGILNGATAVIVTNIAVMILVSAVAILKVIHDRRNRHLGRRSRIAIDMDEVMADALAEHLRRYNAAFDANLAAADVTGPSPRRLHSAGASRRRRGDARRVVLREISTCCRIART